MQQPIWKFLGNRFVEEHVHGNARAKEIQLVDVYASFAVLPLPLKSLSSSGVLVPVVPGDIPVQVQSC
jgi:hypothetical protein